MLEDLSLSGKVPGKHARGGQWKTVLDNSEHLGGSNIWSLAGDP